MKSWKNHRAMAIPTYQGLMLPALRVLGESLQTLHPSEVAERVAVLGNFPDEVRSAVYEGSQRSVLADRCYWALWYMQQAGLVEKPQRGRWQITSEGKNVLARNLQEIDNQFLSSYASFREKVVRKKYPNGKDSELEIRENSAAASTSEQAAEEQTPEEMLESAANRLAQTLVTDLREQMANMNPFHFEQLVVDLLLAMGYGGFRDDAGRVTKKSNDGGIDGVIKQDRLGLDVVYIQAKRYQDAIGRPDIQNFVGALAGQNASKGIFITTSDFRENAREYARNLSQKVILIGGQELAELMIEHDIGVSTVRTVKIKRVDSDYFEG